MRKRWLVCVLVLVASCIASAPGSAAASDPGSNFGPQPSCSGGTACLAQGVQFLDEARARLGEPPYALPDDFASLAAAEQAFVLTDLDRILQGLRPIPGLTDELDQAAAAGVKSDSDPLTSDQNVLTIASDWGGDYPNMPYTYGAWMYDDGPGSGNLDCTAIDSSGCWGHRHMILWSFDGTGALAMGAAAGADLSGVPGGAALLVQGSSSYRPSYVYTWSEALAAGAGSGNTSGSVAPHRAAPRLHSFEIVALLVRGHAVTFHVVARRPIRLSCALFRISDGSRWRLRFGPCGVHTRYAQLPRGGYRLQVQGAHAHP
jgi:hypothetical protein